MENACGAYWSRESDFLAITEIILYTIYYIIYYILYTIYYILYPISYILYTIYYILYTIYYIRIVGTYILHTISYILYPISYILDNGGQNRPRHFENPKIQACAITNKNTFTESRITQRLRSMWEHMAMTKISDKIPPRYWQDTAKIPRRYRQVCSIVCSL